MACPFKVGDIITGKPGNPGGYRFTKDNFTGDVVEVDKYECDDIKVRMLTYPSDVLRKEDDRGVHWVNSSYFELASGIRDTDIPNSSLLLLA